MTGQKESLIYINFLKQNYLILLISSIIGTLIMYLFYLNLPLEFNSNVDLELKYTNLNISTQANLADEIVAVSRANIIHNQVNINLKNKVVIYKSGPVLINISIVGNNQDELNLDLKKIENSITQHYSLNELDKPKLTIVQRPFYMFIGLGFSLGGLIGLIYSLGKYYLRVY